MHGFVIIYFFITMFEKLDYIAYRMTKNYEVYVRFRSETDIATFESEY